MKGLVEIMANKMTYVNAIAMTTAIVTGETSLDSISAEDKTALLEKLSALQKQIENKNKGGEKRLTATQKENEVLKTKILDTLTDGKAYSVDDLKAILDVSQNKAVSLASQLVTANKLSKETIKGKVYYSLVVQTSAEVED